MYFAGGRRGALAQLLYLVRTYAEAAPLGACLRGKDGGVQGEQGGPVGDLVDNASHFADLFRSPSQSGYGFGCSVDGLFYLGHADGCFCDKLGARVRGWGRLLGAAG